MTSGSSQGLFVIVAVVIFGIFVAISYLLFRDKMQIGLANIFGDSITQSKKDLSGKDGTNNDTEKDTNNEDTLLNVSSTREDSDYLYAKIREADASKNETEIWVQAKKLSDGTLQLYQSSTSDSNYTHGTSDMTGSLIIPDTINGMKITSIELGGSYGTFESAKFTGELRLPSSLTTISIFAFNYSEFTGELKLPNSLTTIGGYAFRDSKFSGELKLPSSLTTISNYAFNYSEFTGELKLPSSLTTIGTSAFKDSKFSGELKLPSSLTTIGDSAFYYSQFSGELSLPSSLKKIGYEAFYNSIFTGELKLPSSLTTIGDSAFYYSQFSGELSLPSSLKMIGYKAFYLSTFTGTLDVSNVTYIQGNAFYTSKIDEVIVGDVKMSDGSLTYNLSGIHPNAIKLADGNFYNGSNDN